MTLNKRAKLGIALAIAVLAGLTSGLAGMLVLVLAWLLIVWGQAPERTENFIGGLPGGNYLLRALARIDRIFWPPDLRQRDIVQEEQEELAPKELGQEELGQEDTAQDEDANLAQVEYLREILRGYGPEARRRLRQLNITGDPRSVLDEEWVQYLRDGRDWNTLFRRLRRWRKRARMALCKLNAVPSAVRTVAIAAVALGVFSVTNFVYHVVRKPTEMFFPVSGALNKMPAETWRQYAPLFNEYSTATITPELLAALAQVESAGNPVARTYWRWRLTWHPFEIYQPAFEVEIHDGPYNNIKNWDYAGLIQAFNAEDGQGRGIRVTNGGELAEAIKAALANHAGPTLIECIIDRDDCSSELISWGRLVAIANARPPRPQ